jgi:hypothetical protein
MSTDRNHLIEFLPRQGRLGLLAICYATDHRIYAAVLG